MLTQAEKWELVDRNPARKSTLTTRRRTQIVLTDPEQVAALLGVRTGEASTALLIRLALATGARRGELCGLEWGELGDGGHLSIVRSIDPVTLNAKDPKTEAGHRVIVLDPDTLAALDVELARQTRVAREPAG